MSSGGFRPGAGRPKGAQNNSKGELPGPSPEGRGTESDNPTEENLSPLAYMLKLMNDPKVDQDTRLRAASLAAPYCHSRKGEGLGKKEEKENRAKQAASGKFAAGKPPAKILPFKQGAADEL